MKNLLKIYYELDEETKQMLPFLYMYNELLSSLEEHSKANIKSTRDKDILLQTIIKGWYSSNLEPTDITEKLLNNLEEQNITIDGLENIDITDLDKIIQNEETTEDEELTEDGEIIDDFEYNGYYCIFCKVQDKFLLILNKDNHSDVLIFDSLTDAFYKTINEHLLNKMLNGKKQNDCSNS